MTEVVGCFLCFPLPLSLRVSSVSACSCVLLGVASAFPLTWLIATTPASHKPINPLRTEDRLFHTPNLRYSQTLLLVFLPFYDHRISGYFLPHLVILSASWILSSPALHLAQHPPHH